MELWLLQAKSVEKFPVDFKKSYFSKLSLNNDDKKICTSIRLKDNIYLSGHTFVFWLFLEANFIYVLDLLRLKMALSESKYI